MVLLCSELLQESESTGRQQEQRQSPEETGMCVCGGGTRCGWMCIHVCVYRWVGMYSLLKKLVCVCVWRGEELWVDVQGGRIHVRVCR